VLDSCDLIELFAADAAQAELWTTTTEGHRHFAPGAVRKRLGSDPLDPVHSHLSELGSHPRFAGVNISGGVLARRDDPEDRQGVLRLGPMWPEHPSTLFVWIFAIDALVKLGFKARHLELVAPGRVTRADWLREYGTCVGGCLQAAGVVERLLGIGDHADRPSRGWSEIRPQLATWLAEESDADGPNAASIDVRRRGSIPAG
jgi:hypothetical protein